MTSDPLGQFDEIWFVDFEFRAPPGERPDPHCMVARECRTGQTLRFWVDELRARGEPPFSLGPQTLYVAYYGSAELGCHLALGWPMPDRLLDLYIEFRNLTNGQPPPCGNGLLGALTCFGLAGVNAAEKESLRALAIRGGPFTDTERSDLIAYCETDVAALAKLLSAMLGKIDLPRALLRGRYMAAAARMEWIGTPIDVPILDMLRVNWEPIKAKLIAAVDADYGVYVPADWRTLDPTSRLDANIIKAANEWGVDPHRLAEAVDHVWAQDRQRDNEHELAKTETRRRTGLTSQRIIAWERGGQRDFSTYPGFDATARELAGDHPELGIGRGYVEGENFDATEYDARLWELLRERRRSARPKHDPDILRAAAELVASEPTSVAPSGPLSFSAARFADWLVRRDIPWPRLPSGKLALDDGTFRQMAKTHPVVAPLRELRHTLGELRLNALAVGADGRNRCLLSAFASRTGRNQPSNSKFIFGPSVWLRGFIKPAAGRAVAYVDWEQQEFGIAAALSADSAMMDAYASGDPYLTFAKQAGAVPANATKNTHKRERDQFKVCALAVQYGMGEQSLAQSLGLSPAHARELLRLHRQTYPTFWRWSQATVDHAMLHRWLQAVFGWHIYVDCHPNPRSLANFPMQANGAEMLRLACCLATERGIKVCAPIHDALLVEGPIDDIEKVVLATHAAMAEASRVVLDGFELRTEAKIVPYPDRYMDPRGEKMWGVVMNILAEIEQYAALVEAF